METNGRRWIGGLAAGVVACMVTVRADVWDKGAGNDNSPATQAEVAHGSNELHDLAARKVGLVKVADEDWFRVDQRGQSSYEVVVESVSGELCPVELTRVAPNGQTVEQTSAGVGAGCTHSLRWMNHGGPVADEFIRVASGGCTTGCATNSVYRLRAYETTYAVPRFNNTGTQVSVLMVQNTSDAVVSGRVHFWTAAGNAAGSYDFSLAGRASLVLNTTQVVPNLAGSVTITNDGRYGVLAGKMVGLEPATGFSFDTPMVPRPIG